MDDLVKGETKIEAIDQWGSSVIGIYQGVTRDYNEVYKVSDLYDCEFKSVTEEGETLIISGWLASEIEEVTS